MKKVLTVVDAGLIFGLGDPVPGEMCVEAAVCFALGLPHGDDPPCVGRHVRRFKIPLNDAPWSSPEARANGMRELAVAQLGSDAIDQDAFVSRMWVRSMQKMGPLLFTKLCELLKDESDVLENYAEQSAFAGTAEEAKTMLQRALDFAYGLAVGSEHDLAEPLASASDCVDDMALAEELLTRLAIDQTLTMMMAEICLECLKELNSPGCEWLYLCQKATHE